jgi:hypothetical protein
MGTPLKDWDVQINYGIKTGFNEAFIINDEKREELLKKCPKADEIIRPILRGRDIQKYHATFSGNWLINSHNGSKERRIKKINVENEYPEIYSYLNDFLPKIQQRSDQGDHWTNLRNCAYLDAFEKPKIIYPEITKFINFTYDATDHFFTNNKCFILTGLHLEYLTCFFNSKLFRYCFLNNFPELMGGTRELRKIFLQEIPVKKITDKENEIYKEILTRIVNAKQQNISSKNLKEIVDNIIFDEYSLVSQEIETINEYDLVWSGI